MADGGLGEMGAMGAMGGKGGGGKGGGDSGAGASADGSGLGAAGVGQGAGGMGDAIGGMEAGSPGSGAMAMQTSPSVQAAVQGDPTGSMGATQAMSGGAQSPPGSAGGVGGVQSSPQPTTSPEFSGPPGLQATQVQPTPQAGGAGGTNAIPGSQPTTPPYQIGASQSVPGPTSFQDRFSGEPASFNDRFSAAPTEAPDQTDYSGQSSNTTEKSDSESMPNRFAGAFRPSGLQQLSDAFAAQQGGAVQDPNAASFADRFSPVGETGNVATTDPSLSSVPPSGNINTLGDFDPFTSAVAGGDAIPDSSSVQTGAANVGDQTIPGAQKMSPGTGLAPQAADTPGAGVAGVGTGADVAGTGAEGAGADTGDGTSDGTKPDTGGGTKPATKDPATAPATKPGGAPATSPGGQPGAQPGMIDPMKIIQALLRGGPMGGLLALAQQVMGGSPMGGPNNAPWAPGYGPNNQFRNPQTDAQFGPRDRFGRPIGKGVPTSTSASPPPAVTAAPGASPGGGTFPRVSEGGAAGPAGPSDPNAPTAGPGAAVPDLTTQTRQIGVQTGFANFMGSSAARQMGINIRPNSAEAHNAVVTSRSGMHLPVNSMAAPHFQAFINELEGRGYQINPRDSYGYANRNIASTNHPSQHSYGNAIDINASANPQSPHGASNMPPDVASIAARHGLFWGGNWSPQYRDPMHFEWSGAGGQQNNAPQAQRFEDPNIDASSRDDRETSVRRQGISEEEMRRERNTFVPLPEPHGIGSGVEIGNQQSRSDWPKFEREARPSTNVIDDRNPFRDLDQQADALTSRKGAIPPRAAPWMRRDTNIAFPHNQPVPPPIEDVMRDILRSMQGGFVNTDN